MNIHPIFVHFPVALLSLYSFFEFLRFRKLKQSSEWFYIKATLVMFGGGMGLVAWYTGGWAKHLITDKSLRPLISMHESFATLSIFIFGILTFGYFFATLKRLFDKSKIYNLFTPLWMVILPIQRFITETPVAPILAFLGFICLLVAGALGGSIVYTTNQDPFTLFIYHLFFPAK